MLIVVFSAYYESLRLMRFEESVLEERKSAEERLERDFIEKVEKSS